MVTEVGKIEEGAEKVLLQSKVLSGAMPGNTECLPNNFLIEMQCTVHFLH